MKEFGILAPVVQFLLQRIDEVVRLLGGVKDEVNSLREMLEVIFCYLDQSEGERKENAIRKVVIGQIREKAYEAEDIIDEYIQFKTSKHSRNAVVRTLRKGKLAKEIRRLKDDFKVIFDQEKIPAKGATTSVPESDRNEALDRRRQAVEEDGVVGFDNNLEALVKLFTKNGSQLDVISIIGMGGLGKTTVAKKIYNMTRFSSPFAGRGWVNVFQPFTRRAWVNVSQHDKTGELLLKNILQQMPIPVELSENLEKGMRVGELKETLSKCLNGNRYLIVMDDIWKIDFWKELKSAFPNNSNGSRILITSRNTDEALKARQLPSSHTDPYILPFLNKEESWELFRKTVFQGEECRPELEALGKQLAEGCRGLPLSIVVLGGILANEKQELLSWKNFTEVNLHLTECKDILALSYDYLPQHLKPCFLYLGAYPKDFEIPVRQLIYLWVAEGFILHTNMKPEDVAEGYFKQLIGRNLIQVASKRADRRSVKTCRVHDLLQDFCISQSAEEKFLEVHTEDKPLLPYKPRRLSIQGNIDSFISSNLSHPTVTRSLLFLGRDKNEFNEKHWTWIDENFKLIRVLNFGHVTNLSILTPKGIGKLIQLRYLGITSDALEAITPFISNLTNLETLDMRGTSLNCLPKGIWKLPRLRNLYMNGPMSFPDDLDQDVKPLRSLEVLSTVSLTPDNVRIFMANIPNLRKLGISFADDGNSHVLNRLNGLRRLRKLKIINYSEPSVFPISFPSNITKITLRECPEVGGSMKVLGELSGLMILKLESCSLSGNLEFIAGSFPQLEVLKLKKLRIREWNQERGAMPCLKHLVINQCIELTVLPSESLCALKDVEVLWSNVESVLALQILQKNLRFNLVIDPPDPNDNFYQRNAVDLPRLHVRARMLRTSTETKMEFLSTAVAGLSHSIIAVIKFVLRAWNSAAVACPLLIPAPSDFFRVPLLLVLHLFGPLHSIIAVIKFVLRAWNSAAVAWLLLLVLLHLFYVLLH